MLMFTLHSLLSVSVLHTLSQVVCTSHKETVSVQQIKVNSLYLFTFCTFDSGKKFPSRVFRKTLKPSKNQALSHAWAT